MTLQARYDVIVVGTGLAGLLAGTLAARRGARTLVIARGLGGTHVGPGTVDVFGYQPGRENTQPLSLVQSPEEALAGLAPDHPLTLAGTPALQESLAQFQSLCELGQYPMAGDLSRNHLLPTALGAPRPTCLAPRAFLAGALQRPEAVTLARLVGFRDFYADLAVANLQASGYAARALTLELPRLPARRDVFGTDIARWFDEAPYRAEVARSWSGKLKGVKRLGLPACLGLEPPVQAHQDLQEKLGLEIFEIPILPPSVPGMRLFAVLRSALEAAGGRLIIGPRVTGWVDGRQALGVVAETAGGARRYAARHIILATGGVRHGGLEAPANGQLKEAVFDLPVTFPAEFYAPLYWEAQPYASGGVRVNSQMQPITAEGAVIYPNVRAVGGLLAGAARTDEGSREGIDLATAWVAANGVNG